MDINGQWKYFGLDNFNILRVTNALFVSYRL